VDIPDKIIHPSMRLRIVATRNRLPTGEWLEFRNLKSLLQATDGSMTTHLSVQDKAGYIAIEKDFLGKKPRTRISLTRSGRKALERHVTYPRGLLARD